MSNKRWSFDDIYGFFVWQMENTILKPNSEIIMITKMLSILVCLEKCNSAKMSNNKQRVILLYTDITVRHSSQAYYCNGHKCNFLQIFWPLLTVCLLILFDGEVRSCLACIKYQQKNINSVFQWSKKKKRNIILLQDWIKLLSLRSYEVQAMSKMKLLLPTNSNLIEMTTNKFDVSHWYGYFKQTLVRLMLKTGLKCFL